MSLDWTHVASFGFVELLLMSVPEHPVHHATALPHVEQCLSVLVAHLLRFKVKEASSDIQKQQMEDKWGGSSIAVHMGKLTAISSNFPNSSVR